MQLMYVCATYLWTYSAIYLRPLSVTYDCFTSNDWTTVNNELVRMWKEAIMA
jgi:hypothetical protein